MENHIERIAKIVSKADKLNDLDFDKILNYDKDSGVFTWKIQKRRIKIGDIAGHVSRKGYIVITIDGIKYQAHRLAWYLSTGIIPDKIDHINHIKSDNRLCNLRNVSDSGNQQNKSKQKNNVSGVTGVSWDNRCKKWVSIISVDNRNIYLGSFSVFSDAVNARKNAEVLYGFHENHGI